MQCEKYSYDFSVTDNECDVNRSMTIGSILRRVQQAGTDQCTELGITDEVYARNHCAFLLAKQTLECYAPIPHGAKITVTTRPGTPERAVFFRYTTLEDASGTVLADVDSRWVLVDTETKRIMRRFPDEITKSFVVPAYKKLDVEIEKSDVQPISQQQATYTRCDSNRHINNTVYADIVCDNIETDKICAKPITRFAINYHREVPLGEIFTVSAGETTRGTLYFTGSTGDINHFEAEVTL